MHGLVAAAMVGLAWAGGRLEARDGSRRVDFPKQKSLTAGMKECLQFKEREPGARQWFWHVFDQSEPCPPITARSGWPDQGLPEDGSEVITSVRKGPYGNESYTKTWWGQDYYLELPASPGLTEKYRPCTDLVTKPPNIGRMAQRSECARTHSTVLCRYAEADPFRMLCEDRPKWTRLPDKPFPSCVSKLEQFLDRQDEHARPSNDFCWRRVDTSTHLPFKSATCDSFTYALMTGHESISVIEEIETARAITTLLVPLTSGAFNESPCDDQFEVSPDYYYCPSLNSAEWISVCTQITDSWTSSRYRTRPAARRILGDCLRALAEKEFKKPKCYIQGHVSMFYVNDWDNLKPDLCADEPDADRVKAHYSRVHASDQPIATQTIDFWSYKHDPKWNFTSTLSANTGYISADLLYKVVQGEDRSVTFVSDVWVGVPWSQLSTYRWKGAQSTAFPMNKADLQWPYPRSARRAEGFYQLNELEAAGTYVNSFMAALSAPPAFYSAYPEFDGCSMYLYDPPNGLDPGKQPGRPKVHIFGPDDGPPDAQPTVTLAGEHGKATLPPAIPAFRITSGPVATAVGAASPIAESHDSASGDRGSDIAAGLANLPSTGNTGSLDDASIPVQAGGANLAGNRDDLGYAPVSEADSAMAAPAAAGASGRLPSIAVPGTGVEGGFYELGNPGGGLTLLPNKPIRLANGIVAIANDHDEVQLIDTGDRSFGVEIPLSALDVRTSGTGSGQPVVVATEKLESAFSVAASSKGVTEYRISTTTGLMGQAREQTTSQPVSISTKKNTGGSSHSFSVCLLGICGLILASLWW